MKRLTLLFSVLALVLSGAALYGQPSDPLDSGVMPQRMGKGPRLGRMEPEQRRKYVEQFRLLKLLELLDLKEEQEAKFIESFRSMRRQQRKIEQDRAELMQEISEELERNRVDDARIISAADQLLALDERRREVMANFLGKARTLLTPEQVARLILFQERFELELLERVREFRDRTPAPQPMPEKP